MWKLISSKDKRQFYIIKSLYDADKPITIQNLAEETTSSIRGIQNYLNELNTYFEGIGGEIIRSSDGISLSLPSNIGIDYFQRRLFKQTVGFTLLEEIFLMKH